MGSNFFNLDEALEGKNQTVNQVRDTAKSAVQQPAKQVKQQLSLDVKNWLYGTSTKENPQPEKDTGNVGQAGQTTTSSSQVDARSQHSLTSQDKQEGVKAPEEHKNDREHDKQHRRFYVTKIDPIATIADTDIQMGKQAERREKEEEETKRQEEEDNEQKKLEKKKEMEALPMPTGKRTLKGGTQLRREQTKTERFRGTSG